MDYTVILNDGTTPPTTATVHNVSGVSIDYGFVRFTDFNGQTIAMYPAHLVVSVTAVPPCSQVMANTNSVFQSYANAQQVIGKP